MNISNRTQENLRFFLSRLGGGLLISLAILTLARIILVFSFVRDQYFSLSIAEKTDFWFLSFRFDLKVITIAYALPLLLAMFTVSNKGFVFFKKFYRYYNTLAVFLLLIFSIVNHFYFKTYDKAIDTFIFAISREDPVAVIKTVINDYPVGFGLIGIVVFFLIYKVIARKLFSFLSDHLYVPESAKGCAALFTLLIIVFALLIRGSLGTFPLRQLNAQVTDKSGINYCIPSGILAFRWAYKWEKESVKIPPINPQEIALTYKEMGFDDKFETVADLFEPLRRKTAKNEFLENNRPDIVFNVMESMSTHMMSYDNEKHRDLMGDLRKHFAEDYVFKRFVSEGDGTSDSLTRMFVSVPDLNLSTSIYSQKDYICNIAKLFNDAGYETIFVTASTASWRNYDNFLKALGFSKVIERSHVLRDFPNATSGAWGIDDEYLFEETLKVLKEEHDKPRFIMTLSITNHPPFRMPEDAEIQRVPLPKEILDRFPYENTETIFATFRYANDQLGKFISAVKADEELKNKTFIAATGDHNMRGIGYTDHIDELVFGHEVPFYLYIPQRYVEPTGIQYNKDRLGSQKDIITTIVSHALSDHEFYTFGCDLLSEDEGCRFPIAYNNSVAVSYSKDYACDISGANNSKPSHRIKDFNTLLVETEAGSLDCKKEKGLQVVQSQLYRLQANKPENADFSTQKIQ